MRIFRTILTGLLLAGAVAVMADDTPAKVYSDQRDLPIYLGDSGDGFTLPLTMARASL